jgi:hypothetical protein
MKIEIFTFCDYAQENYGKLTVVGTFDTISAKKFPCIHAQMAVVMRIRFEMWEFGSHDLRLETRDLGGELNIEPIRGKIEVRDAGNSTSVTHLVFSLNNLRFNKAGVITLTMFIDEKEMGSIPLYIRQS